MMTIKKILLLLILVQIIPNDLFAQNSSNPWEIKLGANLINIQDKNVLADMAIGVPSIAVSRRIIGGFSIGAQYSMNKIKIESLSNDLSYYSMDGFLKYSLLNSAKVSPYFFAGYGFSNFEDGINKKGFFPSSDVSETSLAGLGLNVNLSDKIGVNLSSSYRNADETKSYNHLQHFIGISFKLGSSDSDGDGIPDKKDKCPEIAGLKEFNGCPDTDGDGIPDKDDECPEEGGSPLMNGCPDQDGDGVVDNKDACPEVAGSLEMNGCPDSDGDEVNDIDDDCPEKAGFIENNGCPWPDQDGDGVLDKDDECPKINGQIDNGGCPEVPVDIMEVLNTYGSSINFAASSDRLVGSKTLNVLQQIKNLLDQYPKGKLVIEGHTSDDGDEDYNLILSEKRAKIVMEYLINLGIDESRLESIGKGESTPVHDNSTPIGRARNRRVQFKTTFN